MRSADSLSTHLYTTLQSTGYATHWLSLKIFDNVNLLNFTVREINEPSNSDFQKAITLKSHINLRTLPSYSRMS